MATISGVFLCLILRKRTLLLIRYYILPDALPIDTLLIDEGSKKPRGRGRGGISTGRGRGVYHSLRSRRVVLLQEEEEVVVVASVVVAVGDVVEAARAESLPVSRYGDTALYTTCFLVFLVYRKYASLSPHDILTQFSSRIKHDQMLWYCAY